MSPTYPFVDLMELANPLRAFWRREFARAQSHSLAAEGVRVRFNDSRQLKSGGFGQSGTSKRAGTKILQRLPDSVAAVQLSNGA